ncbi:MAG: hypothetical protein PF448_06305 [Bacteroidales bacterium]|jgi:hypothetical protein|nr:hypothetical protein [Bacteroidales bacterium]
MESLILNIWFGIAILISGLILKKRTRNNPELLNQGFTHLLNWLSAPFWFIVYLLIGIYTGLFKKSMIELYRVLFLIKSK